MIAAVSVLLSAILGSAPVSGQKPGGILSVHAAAKHVDSTRVTAAHGNVAASSKEMWLKSRTTAPR